MKGWVYIISNESMPNLIKIGFSLKDPFERAKQLNHTGSPHPYVVDYEILVDNPRLVEKNTHKHLSNYNEGKEWFYCNRQLAVAIIKTEIQNKFYYEGFHHADFFLDETEKQNIYIEKDNHIFITVTIIIIVASLVFLMKSCTDQETKEEIEINKILNMNLEKRSLEMDLNRDGFLDKIQLITSYEKDKKSGLYLFLSNKNSNRYNLFFYNNDHAWSTTGPSSDVWLSYNKRNSLIINTNEFMSSTIQQKFTIAYRNNALVVAGFNRWKNRIQVCDINYLSGTYIINGKKEERQKKLISLDGWNAQLLPATCQ